MSVEIEEELSRLKGAGGLPEHIAIIMDGNGRWAKKRKLPRIAGHREGRKSVRSTVRTCARLGIKVLSLYTFSLENWLRPPSEVQALMKFLKNVLYSEYLELKKNNIQLRAMGRLDMLPETTRRALTETIAKLSGNTGMILNLCLSYGGRSEIVDATRGIVEAVVKGKVKAEAIDEKLFAEYLYTKDLPDPDLLIRTSGEVRVSNFLLWQIAYAEIVVLDVLWPDFREKDLLGAIQEYQGRERRFGDIKSRSVE
ncbi:MAG: isoprenyl transferase [Candidatus Krumholzibacteriota bacterium]|nr:isoprenyl transferase [Candidatus Krumholzibacteriota bacterium]